jgi:tetratricopeptide (TPR) repeat protein/predicted Ser/Thr protein kinase
MIGTILNDRYRVDADIGQGGMGMVYRGYDTVLEREVAIKVLAKTGLGTEGRAQLLDEAQMTAKLNHPNIVTVHDVGEEEQTPFIVMEYVEGKSLHEDKPRSIENTLKIMHQVCAALEHAHAQGIIHRDLKPENVIITRDGTAKLMDFGLARSVASRYTTEGLVSGTVFYLAPEQALGQEIDQRADLYSLGVMLYELTTGELPFVGQDPIAIISQHLHAPVVPPRAKNEAIPPQLNGLILNLLSKDPRDRLSSAREVLQTLETIEMGGIDTDQVEELSLLDRIVRGRMVGRERELNQARQLWQNAKSGEGQLLLISGEPGIGKTRLMREIATQAEVSGGQVLVGECQAEGNAPYAPFAQIARRALRANNGNAFELPKPVLADLLELAPDLNLDYPGIEKNPKLGPEAEQIRLFENMVRFYDTLCRKAPLLVVLEDIHWADSGSLHMLEHLARRTRQQPVMLLGTYREVELDEALPFHEALMELSRRRLGQRVKLDRLDKAKTRELLAIIFAEEVTTQFLEGIYKETEGNPFFIEEVCKALVENGEVWYEGGEWHRAPNIEDVTIPQGVKVAIQSRVSKLTEETQGILLTAAVIGREFDYQILQMVSGKSEGILIDCLEEAIKKQLIGEVKEGGGEQFSFSHALIPATLVESISGLRRTRLHRQVATVIEELHPDDYEHLAYHWGEAGDEQRGLEYTIKAAERARQVYANEDAVRLFTEAITLLAEDDSRRFELLEGRAAVYDVMADRESQRADIEAMLTIANIEGDDPRRVDALLSLASLYLDTDTMKAQEPLEQALKIARQLEDVGREGRTLYYLGKKEFFFFDDYKAREYFEASAKCLQQAGLISDMAESLSFLSVALSDFGDRTAALEAAQEAVDLSKEAGDKQLKALSERRLAIAYMGQFENLKALPIAEAALRIFQEMGDLTNELHALNVLGIIKRRLGMVASAESDFLKGLKIAESIGNKVGITFLLSNISDIYVWDLGDYARTMSLIEDQEEKARSIEHESADIVLQTQKAYLLSRLGKYETALTICETNLPSSHKLGEVSQLWVLRLMTSLCAELERFDQAHMYFDEAEKIYATAQNPFERANLDFSTAGLKLREGGVSNLRLGMEKIKEAISLDREHNWIAILGDALYTEALLHLALLGEDQSQAKLALECTQEALECFQLDPSSLLIMPEQIHFLHSLALRENGFNKEADEFLQKAYDRMMMVAGNISDEDLRRSYLENVRDNRAIQAAYQERFGE